jgi:4-amino-4-deoxy-L-arabinose transferase-like glycosyltransferase
MLAVVYCAANWLFGRRAGLLSAACLLGSYYFARHTRLAETDIPATLFVTLAMYALWRGSIGNRDCHPDRTGDGTGMEPPQPDPSRSTAQDDTPINGGWIGWMHLGAFAIAMSIMSKGAPGAFPIVFLIAYAIVERSWLPLRQFIASGAIVTLLVFAAPWFLFVGHHEGWETFLFELRNVEAGTDHGAPVYQYVPWLIVGTLPWSAVTLIAIIVAARAWKQNWRLRGLLLWFGTIAVPLCLTGNKQSHYLIPLMPVLMIFTGWLIDRWNNQILIGAVILVALVLPPVQTLFLPRYGTDHTRDNAQFVREHFGDSPLCFYGPNESVPLCFNLRRAIEFANDEPELKRFLAREPKFVIITIGKEKRPASAPSYDRFENLGEWKCEDQVWDFYRRE